MSSQDFWMFDDHYVTPSKEEGLLPCPFCGGAASIEEVDNGIKGVSFSAGCCEHEAYCMGYQSPTTFSRRSDAIKAWNKRAPAKPSHDGPSPEVKTWTAREALARAIAGPAWDRLKDNPNSQDEYVSDAIAVERALRAFGFEIVKCNENPSGTD